MTLEDFIRYATDLKWAAGDMAAGTVGITEYLSRTPPPVWHHGLRPLVVYGADMNASNIVL